MTDLLLQDEAAALLRISASAVKRLRLSGRLAYIDARPIRIRRSAVEAYLKSMEVRSTCDKTADPRAAARLAHLTKRLKCPPRD